MKKYIKIFVFCLSFFSAFIGVKAYKFDFNSYKSLKLERVYVVGKYVFDLSSNNNITLKDLMVAAQTTETGNVSIIEILNTKDIDGNTQFIYRELLDDKTFSINEIPTIDVEYYCNDGVKSKDENFFKNKLN